jgi:hypothetical protein
MHLTSKEKLERSMAIKLLIEKWVKNHEIKSRARLKSNKPPIPGKRK